MINAVAQGEDLDIAVREDRKVNIPVHAGFDLAARAIYISLGEFWRSVSFADLKDHEMKKYLKRIADKTKGTTEVPYNEREKFVSKQL